MLEPSRAETRSRIVEVAANLLAEHGRDALTTRAVAAAAGVQAPAIYRLFGDKRGLVDAVAEYGYASYRAGKEVREPDPDPVQDLRAGWDLHVGFGLANPALYALMDGETRPGEAPALAGAEEILRGTIHRIAVAGRLRVSEALAAHLIQASGRGTVLTLLGIPPDRRDPAFAPAAREALIAAIVTGAPGLEVSGPASAAVALRAVLPEATVLSEAERRLLGEWLDRLAASGPD